MPGDLWVVRILLRDVGGEERRFRIVAKKTDTLGLIKAHVCARVGVDEEEVQMWELHENQKYKDLEGSLEVSLEEAETVYSQTALLEAIEPLNGPISAPPALARHADVLLTFDNGCTLPANSKVLCIHSEVLEGLLGGDVQLQRAPGGAAIVPLPATERRAWLLALRLLYVLPPPPRLTWRNVPSLLDLGEKYAIACLKPACEAFLDAADYDACPRDAMAPPPVWEWLQVAVRFRLERAAERCCKYIAEKRLRVPPGHDLGGAAPLLAEYLANHIADGGAT